MPGDALMELSTWNIAGEEGDARFGQQTAYQMFEITDFDFEVSAEREKDKDKKDDTPPKQGASKLPGRGASKQKDSKHGYVTIKKAIDFASPDLFWHGCNNEPVIAWAIIIFREAGDDPTARTPYLRLELRNVQVTSFKWDLDPDAGGQDAAKQETVTFSFETMHIEYMKQDVTGLHPGGDQRMRTASWNFADPKTRVDPIGDSDTAEYTTPPTTYPYH